jgi:hypothetical protein
MSILFLSDFVGLAKLVANVIEIGLQKSLGDAEYAKALEKVFPPLSRDDVLIKHIVVADVLKAAERIMNREAGLL